MGCYNLDQQVSEIKFLQPQVSMPSKRQASAEMYRYMSAPDMYKMSAQSAQLAALSPKTRQYFKRKSRSMFRAGVARAREARSTFNASMEAYKKSIRDTVRRKGGIQMVRKELDKYRDTYDAIQDMLVSVKFQGDVLSKVIDRKRYALDTSSTRGTNAMKKRQYADLRESLAQQTKLFETQQELERRQRMLTQGIAKGEKMVKSLQEKTLRSIETQAQSKALLSMAKRQGLPLNKTTLKGLILAEIDASTSQLP